VETEELSYGIGKTCGGFAILYLHYSTLKAWKKKKVYKREPLDRIAYEITL
jgi:hypothetical protein